MKHCWRSHESQGSRPPLLWEQRTVGKKVGRSLPETSDIGPGKQCWGQVNSTRLDFIRAAQAADAWTHGNIRGRSVALDWRAHTGCRVWPRADRELNKPENGVQTGVDCREDKEGDGDRRGEKPLNPVFEEPRSQCGNPHSNQSSSVSYHCNMRSACTGQGGVWEHLCCSGPGTPGSWLNDII